MNIAAWMVFYAATLTWVGPPVLERITGGGRSARLGVTVWLTAIGGALGGWIAALGVIVAHVISNLTDESPLTLCLDELGFTGSLDMTRQFSSIAATMLACAGVLVTVIASWRVWSRIRRLRHHSHEHARAARIVGVSTDQPDVVIVDSGQPSAYCVAGRPQTIILTTAALRRLDAPQLGAVLAHERAHLTGHHHQILMILRSLARALPLLPLLGAGASAVARLLEMCADDVAVRRHGPHPLLCGMVTLVAGPSQPAGAMGAADVAVLARAARLVSPAGPVDQWRERLVLVTAIALTVATPFVAGLLCPS